MNSKPSKNTLLNAVDAVTVGKTNQEALLQETLETLEAETPKPSVVKQRSREHTKGISAQLHPRFGRELKVMAAEDATTVQELLEEALTLLFNKKARTDILSFIKNRKSESNA